MPLKPLIWATALAALAAVSLAITITMLSTLHSLP